MTNRERIVHGFASLRLVCDPRGHDLLAAIEAQALYTHDQLTMIIDGSAPGFDATPTLCGAFAEGNDAAAGADTHSVRVDRLRAVSAFRCDPDESCGEAS